MSSCSFEQYQTMCQQCDNYHQDSFDCQNIKCLYCGEYHNYSSLINGTCPQIQKIIEQTREQNKLKCLKCSKSTEKNQSKCNLCQNRFVYDCQIGCMQCVLRQVPLNESWIKLKRQRKIEDYEVQKEECACSICLEDIEINEKIYPLECKHIFHRVCLIQWLKTSNKCPNCRKVDEFCPYFIRPFPFYFVSSVVQQANATRDVLYIGEVPPESPMIIQVENMDHEQLDY